MWEISDWRCNMATTTVGIAQNGHLTIPKALRYKYNIKAGTRMEIVDLDGTIVLAKASSLDQMHSNLDRMHDLLESAGGSLDDMMSEIRQAREVA
jgi:AbrB family looped-hinge helix DNA binding protein